ncbi:hypothetical protein RDV89_05175 [Nocardioides zeae]|uniref:DUF559 domain-containing protein n=1 Tax=Nocardioides imazamoxiresistens TaxID=3231893 RepID=A0ABU3PT82_9ACTN|nr:hypothetical protein [Nocardioides zeae]MDT9592447.1 hypothetical protein [Nocardioides zeae]
MSLSRFKALPVLDKSFPLPIDRPFHRHQALREGVPRGWLTALVESGHLRRPLRGVYVSAAVHDDVALRIASLRLVVPDDLVVCDRHAGWLHGAEMVLRPGEDVAARPIRLFRLPGGRALGRPEVSGGQRSLLATDVVDVGGLLVTTPLRTAADLGRSRSRREALAGIDSMLRVGVLRDELVAETDRFAGERWVRTLRDVVPLADPRSASPGESAVKLAWWDETGALPDLQIELTGSRGGRVFLDLGSRALRFAVEYDGAEWHSTPEQRDHDAARRRHVLRVHGYEVIAVRKADVYGEDADVRTLIRAGLQRARRRAA